MTVPELKRKLLGEVTGLFRRNGSVWKEPILEVLHDLRESNVRAVLFGGTLRSLLVSRVFDGRPGRPRDIDVVVSGVPLDRLERQFERIISRRTRFGGLQLKRGGWRFDLWPVTETWAFRQDAGAGPATFARLPSTTPFNLEAIAVEAWTGRGRPRTLFSGNDQFFEGIRTRTIELNRSDNPYPELTAVRAVVMASELGFRIGPRLACYVANIAPAMNTEAVERVQVRHYGHVRVDSRRLYGLIATVARRSAYGAGCEVPASGQLRLLPVTDETLGPKLNVQVLGSNVGLVGVSQCQREGAWKEALGRRAGPSHRGDGRGNSRQESLGRLGQGSARRGSLGTFGDVGEGRLPLRK